MDILDFLCALEERMQSAARAGRAGIFAGGIKALGDARVARAIDQRGLYELRAEALGRIQQAQKDSMRYPPGSHAWKYGADQAVLAVSKLRMVAWDPQ